MLATYLLVQFVAVFGALAFGRAAGRYGAKRVILAGLGVWMGIVTVALFLPDGQLVPFLLLGVAIGIVLGGTQALSRSYFSLLIPRGKEAEYFSFYHAMERGTSWFGTLVFGLVYQFTDSYRPAIFALIVFFMVGGALLMRVDTARGIREAGNDVPGCHLRSGIPRVFPRFRWNLVDTGTVEPLGRAVASPWVFPHRRGRGRRQVWRCLNGGAHIAWRTARRPEFRGRARHRVRGSSAGGLSMPAGS